MLKTHAGEPAFLVACRDEFRAAVQAKLADARERGMGLAVARLETLDLRLDTLCEADHATQPA